MSSYARLGLRSDDVVGARMAADFERRARAAGWSQQQIDHTIKTVAQQESAYMQMGVQDAWADFQTRTGHMLTDADMNFAATWHDALVTKGIDSMPQPSESENQARLQELDQMSKDPAGEYYKGAEAEALQREHLQLLEAGEIGDAQFEQAASQASEQLDEGYSDNAFEPAAEAAEGDDNGFQD